MLDTGCTFSHSDSCALILGEEVPYMQNKQLSYSETENICTQPYWEGALFIII